VHAEKGAHSKECQHLANEHKLLSKISHANIVSVDNTLQQCVNLKGTEICAMFVELANLDLFDLMSNIYPKVLSPSQIREYFTQINKAVKTLHDSGASHNDLKLENIFLYNEKKTAKIADFGFAHDVQPRNADQ